MAQGWLSRQDHPKFAASIDDPKIAQVNVDAAAFDVIRMTNECGLEVNRVRHRNTGMMVDCTLDHDPTLGMKLIANAMVD